MDNFKVKLAGKEEVAERTMAFRFEKPAGFQFKAGQCAELTLLNPSENDFEGASRTFSIASAPSHPELMFATRMQDTAFKRVLKSSPIGTEISLDGPMGSFTLHNDEKKAAIFLAGGIGITPFRSIITDAVEQKPAHHLYMFYSNRRPEDAAFLDALFAAEKANPNFHFIPTMTAMEKSQREWRGETAYIDKAMLMRHLPALDGPIYYIAGPPSLVRAMKKMLNAAEVNPDDVRTEEFGGY
jgi:ferredoxin-NADP reductase